LEIAPVPHRAGSSEWRRLALGLCVLVPVVLLVLLPTVLGFDRYVVTDSSMDGSLARGSVVLAREVAPGDLRVGDVITFRPPGGRSGERVSRRILTLEDGVARTRADATGRTDPWLLRLDGSPYVRVWLGIPWIGYPFVVGGGWVVLALLAVAAFVLALAAGRRQTRSVVGPASPGMPVG
jgi:hypothetical protein